MNDNHQPKIDLRLWNSERDDQLVPFPILTRALNGMQQIMYLLALQQEHRELGDRLRLPPDIAEKYLLQAVPSEQGSFVQPALLGNPTEGLFDTQDLIKVGELYHRLSAALEQKDATTVREIVPERRYRRRVLRCFQEMIPSPESGWRLETKWGDRRSTFDPYAVSELVADLEAQDRGNAGSSVIGKLMRIDFEAKKLTLRYTPTRRTVVCFYQETVEELLLKSPREFIQVIGEVTLDHAGNPIRISDVEDIREVNLSSVIVARVVLNDATLHIDPPLKVDVQLDDSYQCFIAIEETLGINVAAATREELIELIEEDLDVQWRTYADSSDNELTQKAQARKRALRNRIHWESHAIE